MIKKNTLQESAVFEGIGVHTGKKSRATVHPEHTDGITFLKNGVRIPALFDCLESAKFGLNLKNDGETVRTVEHFLACLTALDIWDATIELEGDELPILDGSAAPILNEIESVGIVPTGEEVEPLLIDEEYFVEDQGRNVQLDYYGKFFLDVTIDYLHPSIGVQKWSGLMNAEVFKNEIAYARTFGFLKDEKLLKAKNFALGASLENSVIFADDDIVNERGLRLESEPVRHKVLDLLGDLALFGRPVLGRITSFKGGHELNMKLMSRLWHGQ